MKPEDLKAELVKHYYTILEAACACMGEDPKNSPLEAAMHLKAARALISWGHIEYCTGGVSCVVERCLVCDMMFDDDERSDHWDCSE